jgi:hypothetical protein
VLLCDAILRIAAWELIHPSTWKLPLGERLDHKRMMCGSETMWEYVCMKKKKWKWKWKWILKAKLKVIQVGVIQKKRLDPSFEGGSSRHFEGT